MRALGRQAKGFLKHNWIGTLIILMATAIFFWPIITRISTYSEGGDAMFNAWTLSRNHHCILREGCPRYTDGNIYFPNRDTMLYSETQLSAGVLTLPLHFINPSPIFSYNVWTVASFFFLGWFMYLLAKYLSRNNEFVSIVAGLAFELGPFRMPALSHLQNHSIFYLPLAVLFILKYLDTRRRRYLAFLGVTLMLLFYASWYQMTFALIALAVLLAGMLVVRLASWRTVLLLGAVVTVAVASTLPLAKEYIRFSKDNHASFKISEQAYYSSSLADYAIPHGGTLAGRLYHSLWPTAQINSYNPDSSSYHGFVMYAFALFVLIAALVEWRRRGKPSRELKLIGIFTAIGAVGFILSLGPLLKLGESYTYANLHNGLALAIPLPYIIIDYLLPQLEFIRAIGRLSVLVLFALCAIIAYLPVYAERLRLSARVRWLLYGVLALLAIFELMPLHRMPMATAAYGYNLRIPAVYKFVKAHDEIDDIVVLNADADYPGVPFPVAKCEQEMWAGYHNRNIFNGYSGYTPPDYFRTIDDFNDFRLDDAPKMKRLGLRYVIVDKQLSTSRPGLRDDVAAVFPQRIYEDGRYALFKIQ